MQNGGALNESIKTLGHGVSTLAKFRRGTSGYAPAGRSHNCSNGRLRWSDPHATQTTVAQEETCRVRALPWETWLCGSGWPTALPPSAAAEVLLGDSRKTVTAPHSERSLTVPEHA